MYTLKEGGSVVSKWAFVDLGLATQEVLDIHQTISLKWQKFGSDYEYALGIK